MVVSNFSIKVFTIVSSFPAIFLVFSYFSYYNLRARIFLQFKTLKK
jgi:hypothetical protein